MLMRTRANCATITRDFEYEFLKRMDSKFKYIARDKGGGLFAFESLPRKGEYTREWSCGEKHFSLPKISDFLTFIKREDSEPTSIRELMKEYEEYHA